MFFAQFSQWLQTQLAAYIGNNTAALAAALEPAVVTLAVIYVMLWGYLMMTGRIEEPLFEGVKRILLLAIVLGMALRLWAYNDVIVGLFYQGPAQLAAALAGAADPVATVDGIWTQGGQVADLLWSKGGILHGDPGFYMAAAFVWLLMGAVCVYAMFLLALSKIALAVLLAVGPLFIVLALFDSTKRLFAAWLMQLTNFALIGILTVLVAVLLLALVQNYATQTAALGTAIVTVDALDMLLAAGLVLLILRQVMPMASGLAGGVALSNFHLVSHSLRGGIHGAYRGWRRRQRSGREEK